MTLEQQLQQLLTEAEQVTAKMREALLHLPDYQPQPKLATTYEEVVEAVKPIWMCMVSGSIVRCTSPDHYQLPTKSAANQDKAFIQIKNLEAYCADRFDGERECTVVSRNKVLLVSYAVDPPFKFTKEASDFVIQHFPEIFKTYYGVN